MEVIVPSTELIPAELLHERSRNPNVMTEEQFEMLCRSIERVGFLQPVLVRKLKHEDAEAYEIVDGAHRVRAAKKVGMTLIPCVVRDETDPALAMALQVGMNRQRGELDLAIVSDVAIELQDLSPTDLDLLGFSEDELARLIAQANVDPTEEALRGGPASLDEDLPRPPKPFLLEVTFSNRDELRKVRRALRRAAGAGGDLSRGLLRLCGEEG